MCYNLFVMEEIMAKVTTSISCLNSVKDLKGQLDHGKFSISYSPTPDELKTALELDKQVFPKDRCAKYSVCRFWLQKNPESFIILKYSNQVIGYVCFLPLAQPAFKKYINGEIHEYVLRSKDIQKYDPGLECDCLFCCIIIDKNFRDGEAIKYLTKGYENLLLSLKKRKIKIKNIIADCITNDGEKFVQRMGFTQLKRTSEGVLYIKK